MLLLGIAILYKEYSLTGLNHQTLNPKPRKKKKKKRYAEEHRLVLNGIADVEAEAWMGWGKLQPCKLWAELLWGGVGLYNIGSISLGFGVFSP